MILAACAAPGNLPARDRSRQEFRIAIPAARGGRFMNIQPWELQAFMDSEDVLLVNVKVLSIGHIEDPDLFIPYDQIAEQFSLG